MVCLSFTDDMILIFLHSFTGQKFVFCLKDTTPITHSLAAQKNKATSYHLGQLKAKLAKLKRELISPSSGSGGGGGGLGFDVARLVHN